jgi:alanyl-tRNA synthetase
MTGSELRRKYLDFYKERNHTEIPSASLVPEGDPTTLFTSSGMQPLVPYLLGQKHPEGVRLVDSQKSFRAQDIEEVGDNRHTTFFEMLGNWSLGDYFKAEQLPWVFEFLTDVVGLDPQKLYVTVFSGDDQNGIPLDQESVSIWQKLFAEKNIDAKLVVLETEQNGGEVGMQDGRIFAYEAKKNWWSRSGTPDKMPAGEPGGPDSEIFYDFGTPHDEKFGKYCHPNCDCGRFLEIGNSVFMQYKKEEDGSLKELSQKNVDFGGGLERILAAKQNTPDVFKTDLFWPIIEYIQEETGLKYEDHIVAFRVIVDHLKAATFLISEGVEPSNKQQGYMVRRLLRRAAVKLHQLQGQRLRLAALSRVVANIYKSHYDVLDNSLLVDGIEDVIDLEMTKFQKTLDKGLRILSTTSDDQLTPELAFDLHQTYGFVFEISQELFKTRGVELSKEDFDLINQKHQELSRTSSKGMFKGGLADHSEITTKYHTTTHLIHESLRRVLGEHVSQMGSNITAERLRFDFTHTTALTVDELKQVEDMVNEQIKAALPVSFEEMSLDEAKAKGALAFFGERYSQRVKVYSIGSFSKEVCGGPHVENTSVIGPITIFKQESIGTGKRRIYARLNQ